MMMKKTLLLLLTLALLVSAAAVPALAEDTDKETDQITSATPPGNQGGHGRQQKPGNDGNGQLPQAPGQGGQGGQLPGQGNQNGQQGRGGRQDGFGRTGKAGRSNTFDQLLKDGVISQEVYDAIMAYMNQHASGGLTDGTVPPAQPDGTEPPAQPEGTEPPAQPEGVPEEPAGMEEQLLKDLLDNGVITQEQYDLLLSLIKTSRTDASTT